jgi:hypothetical protein
MPPPNERAVGAEEAAPVAFRPLVEALVLCLALVYVPFLLFLDPTDNGFLWGDAAYYRLALESLSRDGDLAVADNLPPGALSAAVEERQLALGVDGRLVPKHQLLLVFVAYPAYRMLGVKGLLFVNVVFTLVLLAGVLALCRQWVDPTYAFATAFLVGVATLFLPYVYNFSADLLSTALLVWSAVAIRGRAFFAAAVLIGATIAAKVSSLPAAAGVLLLLARDARQTRPGTVAVAVGGGLALGILPYAACNWLLFGAPWVSGYTRIASPQAGGGYALESLTTEFTRPMLRGLWDVLCSFPKGLLVSNPLMLALLGFPAAYRSRRDPFLLLLLLAAAAQVLVIAKYALWNQSHYSNRFLMPAVALLTPHVAMVIEAGARSLAPRSAR